MEESVGACPDSGLVVEFPQSWRRWEIELGQHRSEVPRCSDPRENTSRAASFRLADRPSVLAADSQFECLQEVIRAHHDCPHCIAQGCFSLAG